MGRKSREKKERRKSDAPKIEVGEDRPRLVLLPGEIPQMDTPAMFKKAKETWEPDLFLDDMHEMWYQAVQQEEFPLDKTFEDWLRAALEAAREHYDAMKEMYTKQELLITSVAYGTGEPITLAEVNMGKEVYEMIEHAIRKFLEMPERKRLIAVGA